MSINNEYAIFIEEFAQRHYIKSFVKKYKGKQWEITLSAIRSILSRYDNIAPNNQSSDSKLDIICLCNEYTIIKLDFSVAGTQISAKSSGNRVVAAVDTKNKFIKILLVYSKNEIGPPNETIKWKKLISEYYPEFKELK